MLEVCDCSFWTDQIHRSESPLSQQPKTKKRVWGDLDADRMFRYSSLYLSTAHESAQAVPLRDDGSYDRDVGSGSFRLRLGQEHAFGIRSSWQDVEAHSASGDVFCSCTRLWELSEFRLSNWLLTSLPLPSRSSFAFGRT